MSGKRLAVIFATVVVAALVALPAWNFLSRDGAKMDEKINEPDKAPPTRDELVEWLSAAKEKTVLLPVVIQDDGLGVDSAMIGATTTIDPTSTVELNLDDSGMGISLHDSIREYLVNDRCVVWLKGRSGKLIEIPVPTPGDQASAEKPHDFTVQEVVGIVKDEFARPKIF